MLAVVSPSVKNSSWFDRFDGFVYPAATEFLHAA
jgi:hypothetical protein